MLVEIYGGGFRNKGAQLMLSSVINELSKRIEGIEFCMAWRNVRPMKEAAEAKCKLIFLSHLYAERVRAFPAFYRIANTASYFIKDKHLSPYNLTSSKRCDALVDISGYAFGDFWGVERTKAFQTVAKSYRKKNKPVVMLPQMLGPFNDASCRSEFKKLANEITVVYARDRVSRQQVESIGGFENLLRTAPDITIFNDAISKGRERKVADAFLVPNSHVISKGTTDWTKDSYIEGFKRCYQEICRSGLSVKILVHDYFGMDNDLAIDIAKSISPSEHENLIYRNPDPKGLKLAIAHASFIIGSRFHGLVAALSNNVPTIAIGWAHKYGELLHDFGIEEFNVKSSSELPRILDSLLPKLLAEEERLQISNVVNDHRLELKKISDSMWEDVANQLKSKTHKLKR